MTSMSTVIRLHEWARSHGSGSSAGRGTKPALDDPLGPLGDELDGAIGGEVPETTDRSEAGTRQMAGLGSVTSMAERRGRGPAANDKGIDRLDRAVQRLQAVLSAVLEKRGRVAPRVETELLAIMGEVTIGLLGEAAARAERLTASMARAAGRP
jgi:hypothetical protein